METRDLTLRLELRQDTPRDGVTAVLEGVAVPYGTEIQVSGIREDFAPGAFDVNDVVGKPLFWRHGEQIGRISHAHSDSAGLTVVAEIADTTLGRDAATLARLGGMGLSVGFEPTTNAWSKTRDKVTRMKAALRELSLTPNPAYAAAAVGTIREESEGNTIMPETTEVETTTAVPASPEVREYATVDQVAALERQIAARVHTTDSPAVHPLAQYRSIGEYAMAVYAGTELRAAPDQVTSANPGVMPPAWSQDVKRIVNFGRPAITAMGVDSAGDAGLDFNWPYTTLDVATIVAAQSAEKAALNTVLISILKGTAALVTYGAYSDISYQLLQRSSPSYLEAHNRLMLAGYAATTDNVFADALLAGAVASTVDYDLAGDTTGAAFKSALFGASLEVETATGFPANVVLVASDVFLKAGSWTALVPAPYGTNNVPGTADAGSLDVNVSGLRVVHDRNLAAGSIIVTHDSAASWIESGPFFASADVVSKLGRDVAIYGYGCTAIYNPNGVRKLTNLP